MYGYDIRCGRVIADLDRKPDQGTFRFILFPPEADARTFVHFSFFMMPESLAYRFRVQETERTAVTVPFLLR